MFYSYFSFVLALKTIDAKFLFWSVFLKTQKKLLAVKNAILAVFGINPLVPDCTLVCFFGKKFSVHF